MALGTRPTIPHPRRSQIAPVGEIERSFIVTSYQAPRRLHAIVDSPLDSTHFTTSAFPLLSSSIESRGRFMPESLVTKRERRRAGRIGIDLTKCPRPWLPKGTNTVTFTARIYRCVPGQGWVYPGPKRKITFQLVNCSSERGICLNKGRSLNPDLWFPEQADFTLSANGSVDNLCEATILGRANPPHEHFQAATSDAAVSEATVTVRCEDFGAWGWIEATAAGAVGIPPRERSAGVACPPATCCTGSNRVKIPRDDNGNHIADRAAQDDSGSPGNEDGDDAPIGDGYEGDGLSNYEEYRGFIVLVRGDEKHIRTDITQKDLFVWDRDRQGVGYFRDSALALHFVNRSLLGGANNTEINFNRGNATQGAQHALKMVYGQLNGLLGIAEGGPGVPREIIRIVIDKDAHTPPYDIRNTRAHELGHGINVYHHGQLVLIQPGRIDPKGGLTSGAADCIMRYDNYAWAWRWPAPQTDYPIGSGPNHEEPPGTVFCSSALGTDVNAQPAGRNNRATRGNCRGQMRVNDH